jgi:hypothetical protein
MQRYWRTNDPDNVWRVVPAHNDSNMISAGVAIDGNTKEEMVSLLPSGPASSVSNRPKLDPE